MRKEYNRGPDCPAFWDISYNLKDDEYDSNILRFYFSWDEWIESINIPVIRSEFENLKYVPKNRNYEAQ
ncbi:hypothetical protein LEP1GSC161_0834 [Leptospira santarosai str. CBC1416]|uniref:Uncharacterized protein n=2 Tax=Leptospira santarosai TaxID=28183 RepID=M6K1R2_9LEPT|nr:hypothetical protein LEP1GSC068_3122 [Leptospira sp. Fiocruz LV3954]EKS08829.1 hypothetical protein LEP1GSC071_4091 [Leptospira santarosai str. JET]EMF89836.1 hypothetical protein LEP1GSC005_3805 [Leptospira santarosai str. ST188]EMI68827.1 hypothetical protein LEP1GSC076_2322 [Leptospira sp. Fiocruz LV4135]EMJ50611.1 hypothetical protein LEP1GSC169_3518 [Leptospira santarosai str. HAI1349]EMN21732.1 hypothetical protein LEP1GSC063_3770 [Leptospira santarosai serovar Arenal str. MAVJ 401]E